jgi:hypothetical protein
MLQWLSRYKYINEFSNWTAVISSVVGEIINHLIEQLWDHINTTTVQVFIELSEALS